VTGVVLQPHAELREQHGLRKKLLLTVCTRLVTAILVLAFHRTDHTRESPQEA
jgi:hypothetical protein